MDFRTAEESVGRALQSDQGAADAHEPEELELQEVSAAGRALIRRN
ncbi:MAG: hypothetical protein ACLQU2_09245 [Candidatus Binataceae bacterium]